MAKRLGLPLGKVRDFLAEKLFNERQIENIIPRLSEQYIEEPKYLEEILNEWNRLLGQSSIHKESHDILGVMPPIASAPRGSLMGYMEVNMNTILGDIEPDLFLLDPGKLRTRHIKLQGLNIAQNLGEMWILLYNAPRGFYLQDWVELIKKIYYIEHNIINFLYDKKERKEMKIHPLLKSAAVVESDIDHMRTRYLFALRSGFKPLAHLYGVQTALDRISMRDLILADTGEFLKKFSPFCSPEEYSVFSNLIKNHEIDEDDAEILKKLAELNSLSS